MFGSASGKPEETIKEFGQPEVSEQPKQTFDMEAWHKSLGGEWEQFQEYLKSQQSTNQPQ
jgi:hypothetical protein